MTPQSTIAEPAGKMSNAAGKRLQEISVCICTLKRGDLLRRLLAALERQKTNGLFTYSVVVADNDSERSAEAMVSSFRTNSSLSVTYCVEPQKNIAMARNKAIENASGDFIAFIDDDEFPVEEWLLNAFNTYEASKADGVLGPVRPHFDNEPPAWVTKGKFFERPEHPTGFQVGWEECRTGNVLFRKSIIEKGAPPFRTHFDTAGEDVDFFRRMIDKGCRFVWCNEAIAYETVPPDRYTRKYLLRRALLRGSNFHKHPAKRLQNILKSIVAVPTYTLALPVLLLFGQHVFLDYLIKLLDHASRLLSFVGISLVKQRHT